MLGSGTTVPDPGRGPAGYLVQAGERTWLVDGGSGTVDRCAAAGVDPRALDGGFYSHRHPDHCADLVPLLFSMRVGPPTRDRDYPIWAGEGFAEFLSGLQAVWGKWTRFDDSGPVVHELSLQAESRVDLGALQVITRPANHSAGALHLRFEADDRAVVFSGDTGPSDELVALASGADLLVCECSAPDDRPVEGHMTPGSVVELVEAAQPEAVWLTHFYPGVDPAEAVMRVRKTGVPCRRADDLDVWEG